MKRLLALILCTALVFNGCGNAKSSDTVNEDDNKVEDIIATTEENKEISDIEIPEVEEEIIEEVAEIEAEEDVDKKETPTVVEDVKFGGLDDPELIPYLEDKIYKDLISELNSNDYLVESVEAVYISKEYLADLAYNSQANIFFGYNLDEVESEFQGQRYVFTLGENGQTVVEPMEEVYDDTYDQVIKNVAIGSGVILICVTVMVVSAGVGAPAVGMIFAAGAQTGTVMALQAGGISFAAASIVRGYQTHDFDEAMKAGALAASEGYKWGAITGAVIGGGIEALVLKSATLNGLTMNEAAEIQLATEWPIDAISSIHSKAEYEIYRKAELTPIKMSDGKVAFYRKIDWTLVDEYGRTNVQRVADHVAPIDSTGMPYELHHIGQRADSPLAILTNVEHHGKENFNILHYAKEGKNVSDAEWSAQKKEFWQAILKMAQEAE